MESLPRQLPGIPFSYLHNRDAFAADPEEFFLEDWGYKYLDHEVPRRQLLSLIEIGAVFVFVMKTE